MDITNYAEVTPVIQNGTRISYILPEPGIGFYLAFEDTPTTCVEVNRVQVFYRLCLEDTTGFAQYNQTFNGQSTEGSCVENAELRSGSSLNAMCLFDGAFNFTSPEPCVCSAGNQSSGSNTCVGR